MCESDVLSILKNPCHREITNKHMFLFYYIVEKSNFHNRRLYIIKLKINANTNLSYVESIKIYKDL